MFGCGGRGGSGGSAPASVEAGFDATAGCCSPNRDHMACGLAFPGTAGESTSVLSDRLGLSEDRPNPLPECAVLIDGIDNEAELLLPQRMGVVVNDVSITPGGFCSVKITVRGDER